MAYSIREKLTSPVVQLREDLEQAERWMPQLDETNIEAFLLLLDRIDERVATLAGSGLDLRPERTRQISLYSRLERQPGAVVSAAARAGGLAKLRSQHPPAEGFWWHLDEVVRARRWRGLRRLIFVVGGLLLFFGGLYYAIETFFPPDPQVLLVNEATNELSELALEGRWREALDRIDRTKAQLAQPDAELLIWEGVAAEQLGMIERAEAALAEARDLVGEENADLYWVNLGNVRMMGNDLNGAESAAREALAIDPDEPQAYFLLANVAESRGETLIAIENYERTFELASDTNPQLAVISRVRLGTLLQGGGSFQMSPEPTPTGMP